MKERTQFIVMEGNIQKRKEFYEYIINTYHLKKKYPYFKRKFINNKFPFIVDFDDNSFWICESITCCACAAQNNVMVSCDKFKRVMSDKKGIN